MKIFKKLILGAIILFSIQVNAQELNPMVSAPYGLQVNAYTGNLVYQRTDLYNPDRGIPIYINFTYESNQNNQFGFGNGWSMNYNIYYEICNDTINIYEYDGREYNFIKENNTYRLIGDKNIFLEEYESGKYVFTKTNKTKYYFDNAEIKKVTSLKDKYNNESKILYSGEFITSIVSTTGKTVAFSWNDSLLANIKTQLNEFILEIHYKYDSKGNLLEVVYSEEESIYYKYGEKDELIIVSDKEGNMASIEYSKANSVEAITTCISRKEFVYNNEHNKTYLIDKAGSNELMTTIEFDGDGNILNYIRPDQSGIISKYNSNGELEFWGSTSGIKYNYEYDEYGNFVRERDMDGNTTIYEYYPDSDKVKTITDKSGNKTHYTYDELGNVIKIEKPENIVSYFEYDEFGNKILEIDPKGNETKYSYDEIGNQTGIYTIEDTVLMTYDDRGNMLSRKNENNQFEYYSYNYKNELISYTDIDNITTTQEFDKNGYLIKSSSQVYGDIFYEYNELGRIIKEESNKGSIVYTYDELNQLKSVVNEEGNTFSYAYGLKNKPESITDPLGNKFKYLYNDDNLTTLETDAEGNRKEFKYNSLNILSGVKTALGLTSYRYDAMGNIKSAEDANGNVNYYTYDDLYQLISFTDAKGQETKCEYDKKGNIIKQIKPDGKEINFTYDSKNRMLTREFDNIIENFEYDKRGNTIKCSNNDITIEYAYNSLNKLIEKRYVEWDKTIKYTYNEKGFRETMTDPDEIVTEYEYNDANRLVKIIKQGDIIEFEYSKAGNLLKQINSNGTYLINKYDKADRLLSIIHYNSFDDTIASFTYQYDKNGSVISKKENNKSEEEYEFANNMISRVLYSDGNLEEFEYDATGNRIKHIVSGKEKTLNYDSADCIINNGDTFYKFDNNGNMIQKMSPVDTVLLEYNALDQLIKVRKNTGEEVEYAYSALGQRILKNGNEGNEIRYLYDDDNILLESDQYGITQTRYTTAFGYDTWLQMEEEGLNYTFHKDRLGSVSSISNENEEIIKTYEYDVYGNIKNESGDLKNSILFTGREYDTINSLYFYRSRYYDPISGRFISKDMFEGFFSNPLSLNKYNYCEGNPITFFDPEGRTLISKIKQFFETRRKANEKSERLLEFHKKWISEVDNDTYTYKKIMESVQTIRRKEMQNLVAKNIPPLPYGVHKWVNYINKIVKFIEEKIKKNPKEKDLSPEMKELIKIITEVLEKGENVEGYKGNLYKMCKELAEILFGDEYSGGGGGGPKNGGPKKGGKKGGSRGGSGGSSSGTKVPVWRSADPNDITGPAGYDTIRWISYHDVIPYTVRFENDPDFATAPAQKVIVTYDFDPKVQMYSFRLGNFGFGDFNFEVPHNSTHYAGRLDVVDSLGVYVDVLAGINVVKNQAFWIFQSIDPATGTIGSLPPELGFLLVNDSITHRGEGYVSFTVNSNNSVSTGDTISAQADIIFDINDVIPTNIWKNVVDAGEPESQIDSIVDTDNLLKYKIFFTGQDDPGGVGVDYYNIYFSKDGGPYALYKEEVRDTVAEFFVEWGSTYKFYTLAVDYVGNKEEVNLENIKELSHVSENFFTNPKSGLVCYNKGLNISWDKIAMNRVDLQASSDSCKTFFTFAKDVYVSAEEYLWDIPDTLMNDTLVLRAVNSVNLLPIDTSAYFTVNPQIIVEAGINQQFCQGDTITIGGDPAATGGKGQLSYNWYPTAGLNNAYIPNPKVGLGGQYILEVSDENACKNTDTVNLQMNALPEVILSGLENAYCIGANTVSMIGTPEGGAYSGAGVAANNFDPTTAGAGMHQITYTYVDENNCANIAAINVAVNDLPVVSISGLSTQYCRNAGQVTITVSPEGGQLSGQGIAGNIFSPAVAGEGQHKVSYVYTDANNCVNSDTVKVTVNEIPILSITGINTQYCADAQPATIIATPQGGMLTGAGISGETFYPSLAGEGQHAIAYTYTNNFNCTEDTIINVMVHALPQLSLGIDTTIKVNQEILLDAGEGFASYLWNTGDINQTLLVEGSVVGVGKHEYWAKVTNSNYCQNLDTIIVTVDNQTGIDLFNELTVIKFYPNPTSGKFYLEIENHETGKIIINIIDPLGSDVFIKEYENNKVLKREYLDLSEKAKGIYLVKVTMGKLTKVEKLIIY